MEAFTLSDVPIYTGVSRPTLQKWIDRGWVRTFARTDAGPEGSPLFTRVDLNDIAFLQKVMDSGFSRDLAVEKINIGDRLKEGADDFCILNFSRLANRVDRLIEQASGV